MTSPSIKAVLVLDGNDGTRIHAKYFGKDFSDLEKQHEFEKNLFNKTRSQSARSEAEIVMLDKTISVYRHGMDVGFYVVGSVHENELILAEVLKGLYDSLSAILRHQMEKRVLLENLELVLLAVDELVDGGLILESDSSAIANRVLMHNADPGETNVAELTVSQALESARKQLARSFAA
mmetsp:Transcript_13018/g.15800  ORF Transcript_13018/g.15800 Transcript_13018/m.15800 type:complete len:179 (+) Transcript_13018:400-936(+)|eukprot:CAMPEP_0184019538 /NCGR_PEP_ID=MMETSP0954-20121128/8809_1 /TAXON_ID=627963 /ORGANISM="Aplanochytrium sp, Strain PBS07" /LENGTH=178 /DNA_ID=CAMNT_0026301219 /DNA_START=280 /DNA_END=816 /DNA_ORIENTATION=+